MAGDTLLSNIVVWPFLKKDIRFEMPKWENIRQHIAPMLLLFIPILAMSVFRVMDKSMLDIFSTEANVGFYYSADKIINIPLAVITALSTVMMPRISNMYNKGLASEVNEMLRKTTEVTIFLACAIGVGIASISKEFVPFFFGEGFSPCIVLICWFTPVLLIKAIGELVRSQFLIPAHYDKLYTVAICIGAISNCIANVILIPKYGALGAVQGTLIAETVVTIVQIMVVHNVVSFTRYIIKNMIYLPISGFMFITVRAFANNVEMNIVIKLIMMVIIGATVYISACMLLWKYSNNSCFSHGGVKELMAIIKRKK